MRGGKRIGHWDRDVGASISYPRAHPPREVRTTSRSPDPGLGSGPPGGYRAGAATLCVDGRGPGPLPPNGLPDHRSIDGADYQLPCSAIANRSRPFRYEDSPEGGQSSSSRRPRRTSVGSQTIWWNRLSVASPAVENRPADRAAVGLVACPRDIHPSNPRPRSGGGPLTTSADGEQPRHVIRSTPRGKPWDVRNEGQWA